MRDQSHEIAVLIPAYNPSEDLIRILHELRAAGFRNVFVVDDGSKSKDVFEKITPDLGVKLLQHERNQGKGSALKTGYREICNSGAKLITTIITMDADGQHLVEDVVRLRDMVGINETDLILGVRRFDTSTPLRSSIGNMVTRLVLENAENINLTDTQTGLRAFPVEYANACCDIRSERYEFELESILLAKDLGMNISEMPITTVYIDDNASSHFRPIIDSMRVYAIFARFISVSLGSFLIDISLFAIIYALTSDVFLSTYTSRSISASINFLGNKYIVFRSRSSMRAVFEATGYVFLVFSVATLSAYLVDAIDAKGFANVILLKILVDTMLFFGNFFIQRFLLFNNSNSSS